MKPELFISFALLLIGACLIGDWDTFAGVILIVLSFDVFQNRKK